MAIQPPEPRLMTGSDGAQSHVTANAEAGPSRSRLPAYRLAQSLSGHRRSVTALEWTRDGRTLISAGADGLLNFWSAPSSSVSPSPSLSHTRTLRAHRTGINSLSTSPDDLYVATASDDNAIHVFPVSPTPPPQRSSTGIRLAPPLRALLGHTAPVLSVAFSPKSNLLVSGSFDESAIVWDVRRGTALRQLPAHSEAVWTVGWDGEGVMVLTGSADGLIRLWDATTGQCLKTLDNDSNAPFTSAQFTSNPFYLVAGTAGPPGTAAGTAGIGATGTVRVYNIHTGKVVKTLRSGPGDSAAQVAAAGKGIPGPETGVGAGVNGNGAASGSVVEGGGGGGGGGLGTLIAITPALPARTNVPAPTAGGEQDMADRMEVDAGKEARPVMNGNDSAIGGPLALATQLQAPAPAHPAKQAAWILATGDGGRITIWDLSTRRVVQVLDKHVSAAVALAVSPNGRMIATGSIEPEKVVHVWRDDE